MKHPVQREPETMDWVVLPFVIIVSILPSHELADRSAPNNADILPLTTNKAAPHSRLKRGWTWNELLVEEEDPILRVIGKLQSDSDSGDFGIKYILSGEGAGEIFQIDEYSGEISSLKVLDREEKAFYILRAQAIDRRTEQPVEPESEFIIKVKDINDNAPVFQNEPYVSSIPEMCPVGTTVTQVTATDADDPLTGNNAKLLYSILQGEPYFSVEPKTGVIVTSWQNMDRETRERYLVEVQVTDMMGLDGGFSATTTVTITLSDVNDNGPTFQHNLYTFAVLESAAVGTTVGRIMADDGDIGVNARMNYSLEDLEESSTFKIQTDPVTQEGIIILAQKLDYESKRRFVISVDAVNDYLDTRFLSVFDFSDRTMVKIMVKDVDEPPVFSVAEYEWKVPENAIVGTQVGMVTARDTDAANNPIKYSVAKSSEMGNIFRIDPNNGTVTVANPLDRETADWHNLTISAKETREGYLSSLVEVFIRVLDINDNAPQLSREYQPHICEGTQAGEIIQTISATDLDDPMGGHNFYFSMIPGKTTNPNFTIRDNQDNTAGILARRSTFSRKDRTQYLLPVVVTDNGSPAMSSTSTLTINVCICQPAGHCPSGGVEAFALSMGLNLQGLMGLLICLATLAVLSVLILAMWRHRKRNRDKSSVDEMETLEYSEKILRYSELNSNCQNDFPPAQVPLRPHPRHRERRLRREEVAASIRMSLRHSHLIGPEDEVFRQFIMDRLAEADQDPYAPPFDYLRTYAFEGTGSATGSLSSLESFAMDLSIERPQEPSTRFLRLTPWLGGTEEETSF